MISTGSWWVDVLLGFATLCLLFYWFMTRNIDYWEKRGVPHAKKGLIIENLLGRKSQADVLSDIYKRFINEPYFGLFQVNRPMIVINDLELVNKILVKDFSHFQDRGQPENAKDLLSKNLFNLKGQIWRLMRYKLTPTFTTGKIKSMFEQVSKCGSNMIKNINDQSAKDPDVNCKDFLFEFTSEVISSCAFGIQFDPKSEDFEKFKSIIQKMFRPSLFTLFKFIFIIAFPKLGERLNLTFFINKDAGKYFLDIIKSTIKYRADNNIKRNDYLQMLITLKEQEDSNQNTGIVATDVTEDDRVITDHLKFTEHDHLPETNNVKLFTEETVAANSIIFLIAGSESTSNTTSLTLFEIARHPDIQLKLQQEVDKVLALHGGWSYQALKEMTFLDQVIQEAQRCYPLLPLLQRECVKAYKMPGSDLVIEEGVLVAIPVIGLQKDAQYYPEPEEFKPERFEGNNFKPSPTFLPFGDGPRMCIAMRFAVMEMKTAIARIVANYNVSLSPKTKLPLKMSARSFVPVPEDGLWLNFEKRSKEDI